MPPFRILPAGDSALLVELPARIDPALNTWCVALAESLTLSLGAVVRDVDVAVDRDRADPSRQGTLL